MFDKEQTDYLHQLTRQSIFNEKELGCNIFRENVLGEIEEGEESGVYSLSKMEKSIGTFHTHPDARARPSTNDFLSAISRGHCVICIGGKSIKGRKYRTEIKCYIADPNSDEYFKLKKTVDKFSIFLDGEKLQNLAKEIHKQGLECFREHDLGVKSYDRNKIGLEGKLPIKKMKMV